jgi:type I restriction enzyme S subunit
MNVAQSVPLRHVADVVISNVDKKSVAGETAVRLVNYTDVYYGDIITPVQTLMSATASEEQIRRFGVRTGDTIITKDSETPEDIAIPAYVGAAEPDMVCGYHLAIIRPHLGVHPRFLNWAMHSIQTREQASMAANGMTRYGISQGAIRSLRLPVPPTDQQRRIADFLDDQVTRIDNIIKARRTQMVYLSDLASSHSESLLMPRVEDQPRWRANRHLAVELATSLTPPSWRRHRFKSLLRPLQERRGDQDLPMLSLSSQGYLYDRQGKDDRQQASDGTISRNLVVHPGDLVVNPMWITGGSVAVSDRIGTVSPDYRVFRAEDVTAPRFIHHLLRSRPYQDQYRLYTRAETTFDRRVRQDDLDELPIVLPSLTEQVGIAEQLDEIGQRTAETIQALQEVIRGYEEMKRSLISSAVSGEFDVAAADGSGVLV